MILKRCCSGIFDALMIEDDAKRFYRGLHCDGDHYLALKRACRQFATIHGTICDRLQQRLLRCINRHIVLINRTYPGEALPAIRFTNSSWEYEQWLRDEEERRLEEAHMSLINNSPHRDGISVYDEYNGW